MSGKKSYSVTILGNSYHLVSDEDPSHVSQVGIEVDSVMRTIQQAGVTDMSRTAVLAALQIASKSVGLERTVREHESIEKELVKLIDEALLGEIRADEIG